MKGKLMFQFTDVSNSEKEIAQHVLEIRLEMGLTQEQFAAKLGVSFPGPLPPLKIEDLNKGSALVRTYRNRRIGDFLKELHLTEGRRTRVPKIHKAMKTNGSPHAIFETNDECHYFLTILPIHPEATRKTSTPDQNSSMKEQTHQPTGVSRVETHRSTGVFPIETLPKDFAYNMEFPIDLGIAL